MIKTELKITVLAGLLVLILANAASAAIAPSVTLDYTGSVNGSSYNGYIAPGGHAIILEVDIQNSNDTEILTFQSVTIATTAASINTNIALPISNVYISYNSANVSDVTAAIAGTPQVVNVAGQSWSISPGQTKTFYISVQASTALGNGDAFTITASTWSFIDQDLVVTNTAAARTKTLTVAAGFQTLATPSPKSDVYTTEADGFIVVPAYGHPTALWKFGGGLTAGGRFVQSPDRPSGVTPARFSAITVDIIDTLPVLSAGSPLIWPGSMMDTSFVTVNGATAWGNLTANQLVPNDINISSADFSEWAVYEDINNNKVWDAADNKLTTGAGTFTASDSGWHRMAITFTGGVELPEENTDSVYLLTFRTSAGWGSGKAGFGDEFAGVVRQVTFGTAALTDTAVGGDTRSCMVYETVGPVQNISNLSTSIAGIEASRRVDTVPTAWRLMDVFFGLPVEADPATARNNNQYLDYVPDAVLGLNLTMGPVTQWSSSFPSACDQALQSILLRFNYMPGGFDISDIRALSADNNSGVCLYRDNTATGGASFSNEFDENDVLVPISVAASRWETVTATYADLKVVLAAGEKPTVTDWNSSYNQILGGSAVDNSGLDYFVTVLLSESADADDSFAVTIINQEFTGGFSNSTMGVHIVKTDTIVVAVPTQVIDMVQYWPKPGKITEQSNPMPVLGFNVRDNNADTPVFLKSINLHVFNPAGTNFTVDELLPLRSDTMSGVAIFRDNKNHPLNTVGMFDSGIDFVVPLNGAETWTYSGYQDHYDQHYLTMTVANPQAQAPVPNDNAGGNAGADFYVVIRTSSTAGDGHSFYFKLVDPASVTYCDQVGNNYSVTYRDNDAYPANHENNTPATANDMWCFTGQSISVVAISAMNVQKLTTPGQFIDASSNQVAVLGINISDGGSGGTLTSVTVACTGAAATGAFSSTDLATLATDYTSGLSLYQDNGDSTGVFDANDDIIQIGLPVWSGSSVTLSPTAGVAIPASDAGASAGDDFFVVLRTSATINYRDSFTVTLPPGGVSTSSGVSDLEMTVTTDAVTCRVPAFITNLTSSGQAIRASDTVTVFGINMRDTTTAGADGGDKLTKITVAFSNIGADFDFTASDLASVADTSTLCGVAIWADVGAANVGSFDRTTDQMLPYAVAPSWFSLGDSQYLVLDITDTDIPGTDLGNDAGYDYYIVITSSNTISYGDNFSVTIPTNGLEALSGKVEKTAASNVITSNAVTSTVLTDLVGAGGALLEPFGETLPLIGINVYDAPTGSEYINQVTLRFVRVGTDYDFVGSDLAALASDPTGGVQLYRDDGTEDGVFDPNDSQVPLNGSQSWLPASGASDSYTVTLIPFSSNDVQLPGDNITAGNVGADYFVVIKSSSTMNFLDNFYAEILPNGISYSAGAVADTVVSGVVTSRVPVVVSDLATTAGNVYKKAECDTFAILGLNTWDNGRGARLQTVKVTFTSLTGFDFSDILVAFYRDSTAGTNGTFDTSDVRLAVTRSTNQSVLTLTLAASADSSVPDSDVVADLGDDFFVVISTTASDYWKSNDRFTYAINPEGLEFETGAVTYTSDRSGSSYNSVIGDITPPGHVATTSNDADKVYASGDTVTFTSRWTEAVAVVAYFPDTTVVGSDQGGGSFLFRYTIPTPATGQGDTGIQIVATDAQGNTVALVPAYNIEIDTNGPTFSSWWWGDTPPTYQNGDTITLYARFDPDTSLIPAYYADSIVVTADFSRVDSNFDTSAEILTRIDSTTWKIAYRISAGNTRSDADTLYIRLLANDYANYVSYDSAWVKLDNAGPLITAVNWLGNDQNVRDGKVVQFFFNANELTDTTRTVVDFGQVDAGYLAANVTQSCSNGQYYRITYTITSTNTRSDNEQIAIPVTLYDVAGNVTTDSVSVLVNLDNSNPSALITSPVDSTAFNSSPISIFGTAVDVDGNSGIDGKQASEVASVHLRVISDTGYVLPGLGDTLATSTADTSVELEYSKWQYIFSPPYGGTFFLSVVAVDKAGNPVSYAGAFADTTVVRYLPGQSDLLPPSISNVQAAPSPFSPNGDGTKDTTYLQYTLSEVCRTVGITITNSVGTVVRVLAGDTGAGANEEAWDGRHTDGYILPDGVYTFTITATDSTSNSATINSSLRIATSLPTITSVSAAPAEISPNGDGINEQTAISFTVGNMAASEQLGTLTFIKAVNSAAVTTNWASPVFTPASPSKLALITQIPFAYGVTVTVQGTDINGYVVSDQFTISANTAANTTLTTTNGTVFRTVSSVSVATTTAQLAESFNYNAKLLTNVGSALLRVVDSLGAPVTASVALTPNFIGAGTYSGQWPAGAQADGVYTYQITVIDDFGNEARASGNITCASTRILLSGVAATPNTTISPNGDLVKDYTFITYTTNKAAQVTIKVFSGATAVRTLQADTVSRAATTSSVQWDGEYDSGSVVPDGIYEARVTAYDPLLNETVQGNTNITVDVTRPNAPVIMTPQQEADTDGNNDAAPGVTGFDDDNDGLADALDLEVAAAIAAVTLDGVDNNFNGTIDEATETYVANWDDNENGQCEEPYFTASASVSVTGTAEAGSTVTAYINGGAQGSTLTDAFTAFTVAAVPLSEGLNRLTVRATDPAGNVGSATAQERIILDTLEPAIDYVVAETTVVASGETLRSTITQFYVFLDDGALGSGVDWINSTATLYKNAAPQPATVTAAYVAAYSRWCLTVVPTTALTSIGNNGSYELRVAVRDRLGNSGTDNLTFTYQNLTPVITSPTNNSTVDNVSVAVTGQALATSTVYFQYSADSGTAWTALDTVAAHATLNLFNKTITLPATNGAYTLRAYSELGGVASDYSNSVVVFLNTSQPVATITHPADDHDTNVKPIVITGGVTGGVNPTYLKFSADLNGDGTADTHYFDATSPYAWSFNPPTANRDYTFWAVACKAGDTTSVSSAVDVTYDTVLPRATASPETGAYITDTPYYVDVTVIDTGSGADFNRSTIALYRAGVLVAGGTIPVSATTLRYNIFNPLGLTVGGQYGINYTIYDKAGNSTGSRWDTFTFVGADSRTLCYLVTTGGDSLPIDDGEETRSLIRGVYIAIPLTVAGDSLVLTDESGAPVAGTTVAEGGGNVYRYVTGHLFEGRYAVNITQGLMFPPQVKVTFTVDTTPPGIYSSPDTGEYTNSIATVAAYITDTGTYSSYPSGVDFSGCAVTLTWPGGINGPGGTVDTTNSLVVLDQGLAVDTDGSEDGACSMFIVARDAVGNDTARTVRFYYDSQSPDTRASDPYLFWSTSDTRQGYQTISAGSSTDQDIAVMAVALTDSWINAAATTVKLYTAAGVLVAGYGSYSSDTFYWYLTNPLNTVGEAGNYQLRLSAADRAGNLTTENVNFSYSPFDIEREIVDYATIEDTPSKTGLNTRRIEPDGDWTPVLRLKLRDANNLAYLQGLRVEIVDTLTANISNSDFGRKTALPASIVALYGDGGTRKGFFDASDAVVAASYIFPVAGSDTLVDIALSAPAAISDTYTYFYVAVKGSRSMSFRDDFTVMLPQNRLALNIGSKNDTVVTGVYSANMPVFYTSLAPDTSLNSGCTVAVIGINVHDNTVGNDNSITRLRVTFAGGTSFNQFDIASIGNTVGSGVMLFRDNNGNGGWDAADAFVAPSAMPSWGFPNRVTLTYSNCWVGESSLGDSFFVVVRTSSSIQTGDTFTVSIASEDLEFTGGEKTEKAVTTGAITSNADYDTPTAAIISPLNGAFLSNWASVATAAGKADIIFVVDKTGSMGSVIDNVQTNINAFVTSLVDSNVDVGLGLIGYGDVNQGEAEMVYPVTTDVIAFKTNLAAVRAAVGGGGDLPESGLEGIIKGIDSSLMNFRTGANKFVVLVTDAEVINTEDATDVTPTLSIAGVISSLQSADMVAYVIYTVGATGITELDPIAVQTGGDTGDLNQPMGPILASIASSISSRAVVVSTASGRAADAGGSGLKRVQISYQAGGPWFDVQTTDSYVNWTFNYQSWGLADGKYTLHVKVEDKAGNIDVAADSIVVYFDSTEPVLALFDTFALNPAGMIQLYGAADGTGEFGTDSSFVTAVEFSLDNVTWTAIPYGTDGIDNDGDLLMDEEDGALFNQNDDWDSGVPGLPGDFWYDDPAGTAGRYDFGVDDVYLGVASETNPARFRLVNTVLYGGSNNTADAQNYDYIYSLQDEDFADTSLYDAKNRWVTFIRPTVLGAYTVYVRASDRAGNRRTQAFNLVNSQAVTAGISDLVPYAAPDTMYIEAASDPKAVLGLNLYDGVGATDKITSLSVRVAAGAGLATTDFATLANDATGGVMLYADNGLSEGIFDTGDQPVALAAVPTWASGGGAIGVADTVTFALAAGLDIPDNDLGTDSGTDYFVVVRTSGNISYTDQFVVSVLPRSLRLQSGYSSATGVATAVQAKIPVSVTPLVTGLEWTGRNDTVAVFRIGARDNGVGAVSLNSLTLRFANVGGDAAFTQEDLQAIPGGLSDVGGIGLYTTSPAGWINLNTASWLGNALTITTFGEAILDAGETFTVYVRTSSTISDLDDFTVAINAGDIAFDGFGVAQPPCQKTGTTAALVADAGAAVVSGSKVYLNGNVAVAAGADTVYMYGNITSATATLADTMSGLYLPGCSLWLDTDVAHAPPAGAVYHDGTDKLTWLSNPTREVVALTTASVQVMLTTTVQDASTLVVTDSAGRDVTARLAMSGTNGSKKVTYSSLLAADSGTYTFLYDPTALASPGGVYYAQVTTMDAAGNVGMETFPFRFNSGDVDSPTILSISPDTGEIVGSVTQVKVLVYDALSGIDFSRSYAILYGPSGQVLTTKNFTLTPQAVMAVINTALAADGTVDGTYRAGAVIYDKAGNVTVDTKYFTYNSSLPVIISGSENATSTKKAGDVITFTLGCAESRTEQNLTVRADSTVIISPPVRITTDTSLYTVRSASSSLQNFADATTWRIDYVAPNFLVYFGAASLARLMNPGDSITISYTSPAVYGSASVDIGVLVQGITLYDDGDSLIDGSGSDGNDQRMNDGIYTGRYTVQPGLNTSDAAINGHFSSQSGKVATVYQFGAVTIDSLSPVISGVSTTPNPFNPQATGSTSIRFNLNEACAAVTVKIYNSLGALVRTIVAGAKNAGANSVSWTGGNDLGVAQPAGQYTITLSATDLVGNSSEVNSSVAITNLSLTVQNITLSTDPLLLPAGDGVGDQTTITFDVYLSNATADNLAAVGINFADDVLGTILGPDADNEPFAFTTLSLYDNVGNVVTTFDQDGAPGSDEDLGLCAEYILASPATREPDGNDGNDFNNMIQLRDDGNGILGDGIFTGSIGWTFAGALAEGTYQVIAQYELVTKAIVLAGTRVDSGVTISLLHAQPAYGAGLTTDQGNPASASLRVQPLVVPGGDATAPVVTLVTARLAGGGTSNIMLTSPTLYEAVNRVSAIMDDGFGGSGVSLTNSTIRLKNPYGALVAGSQNNDGSTTIWWDLTSAATLPGLYTVEVTPRDVAGNVGAMVSKTFTIGDFTAPTVISYTADQYAVSANGSTSIADNISKVAATLQDQDFGSGLNLSACTIRLYDESGNLLAGAQSSDSLSTITWTVTSELTQSLTADQRYRIVVYAVDLGGYSRTDSAWFTITKLADNSGVTYTANSFGCTPPAISPNADGRQDTCRLTFIATGTDTIYPVVQFFYGATAIATLDTTPGGGLISQVALGGGMSRYTFDWNPSPALIPTLGVYTIEVKLGNRKSGALVLYPSVIGRIIWDTLIDTPVVTAPTDSLVISSNSSPYALTVTGTYGTNGDSVYLRVTPPSGATSIAAQLVTSNVFSFGISLVYGWTTLEVWAVDTAGNISGIITRRVRLVNGSSPTDIIITIGTGTTRDPVIHAGDGITIGLPFGTTDGDLTVYSTDGRSTVNVRAVDTDGDGNVDKITWDGTGNNIVKGVYIFKLQYTLNGQVYIETFPLAIVP